MLDTENRTTFNGNRSRLENLELLDQIHQDALRVLEEVGVKCDSSEVRQIFEETGLSALLTLTHAEALFGITLAQLINPGTTVVHAGLPSIANIQKNYAVDLGLVSHNMANLLMDKINKKLDLPSIHSACTTSQAVPNEQSEKDASAGYAIMKKYGFHQMRHAFGFLKELVSFSITKLVRHIELCRETGPDQAPEYEIDPYDTEGFDTIARNGSSPNYMRDDHTLKNTGKSFVE